MAANKKIRKSKLKLGRPPVDTKKIPFQVMLDPRYLAHFRKMAKDKKIQPQDLARMALNALIPNPYIPDLNPSNLTNGIAPKRKRG